MDLSWQVCDIGVVEIYSQKIHCMQHASGGWWYNWNLYTQSMPKQRTFSIKVSIAVIWDNTDSLQQGRSHGGPGVLVTSPFASFAHPKHVTLSRNKAWNLYSQIARLTLGDEITRSEFWGGRKPECPEETLEVRLRSTETQSTYYVVEVKGVIDVHYASLTSRRGGRHDNLVSTLTLTQCDPPLKNPGYAPGLQRISAHGSHL